MKLIIGDGSGNVSSTINRGGQRKLRSKRGLDGGEVGSRGGAGGGGGRRKQALTGLDALGVNTMLPEPDVYEDLLVILRVNSFNVSDFYASSRMRVVVEDRWVEKLDKEE